MMVVRLKLMNRSPFPGFVDKAELVQTTPTTKKTTAKVTFIDKRMLYWLAEKDVEFHIAWTVAVRDALTTDDPEFRLQLFDDQGQQIETRRFEFKAESRVSK